jgi:hypothetical protein
VTAAAQREWAVVLATLSLLGAARTGRAQERLRIGLRYDFGASFSNVAQVAPADWQTRYQPAGGSMQLHKQDYAFFWDVGAAAELAFPVAEESAVGLTLSYCITLFGRGEYGFLTLKKTVAATTVDWWNSVSLLEVKMTRTTPAIGLALHRARWTLELDAQAYRLSVQDFRGIDRSGRPNTAEVVGERTVGTGVALRAGLSRLIGRFGGRARVGGYCEAAGLVNPPVLLCGLSLSGVAPPF